MSARFDLQKYIEDIELNELRGRMVNAPATTQQAKNVNILLIHGHHSSHERLTGVAELLQKYGNVCMPDLPGFGGMTPLFDIGEKPTIDNLADYLASFIKMHYGSRKKFIIVGYSMGFLVVARLLQKYPTLHKQVIDVVAVAGLVHRDDIRFSRNRKNFYYYSALVVGTRLGSFITREIFLRKWFLGRFYAKLHNAKEKFEGLDKDKHKEMIRFEIDLWRMNDVRTWCYTTREMLRCDLVTDATQLPLDVISVVVDNDRYFDNKTTEQHLNIIFRNVKSVFADVAQHGGSKVETAKDAAEFIPKTLRNHLKSLQ
jgi:pimeloyl-ACP methyl ester carboxylesterase